ETAGILPNKNLGKASRELGNAGHSDRRERPRAKLTGAAGHSTPSTRGVRHAWMADVDLAPAFVRHNHALPWRAGSDPGRLVRPRAHPSRRRGAIDCGSPRTCFPGFCARATRADQAAAPAWLPRYPYFEVC